ncbi:hypothetical protein SELMODRAFT_405850 [Selaginella moellendorffii]|uniref:Uncharacterized protein n=1 Tax=Selaginella moellendorffii TaxID=88036 RepID=D8QZW3_SELML|nr:hypothetical protein SELMODRAFT_405850 [Selaginella moellendorffii]
MRENTSQPLTIRRRLKVLKDTKEGNVQTQLILPSDKDEGYIWRTGYKNGEHKGQGEIFRTWFIIFAPHISFLFRNKREALSVGADEPSQITSPRAVAAKDAGLDTVILERPGNAPLPSGQQAPFGTLMILKVCKLLLKQRIAPCGFGLVRSLTFTL